MTKDENGKGFLSNAVWKLMERISAQLIAFIVSVVLARMLRPEAYSTVGIVTIFFSFANVFVTAGLNTALIQKKDTDEQDYASVLAVSLLVSIVMYAAVFFSAPLIAKIYELPELILIFRVMGIILPVNAVQSVWTARVSKEMHFKKFFFSTIGANVISGVVGIIMARKGFGAWALVTQQMTSITANTVILLVTERMRVFVRFSFEKMSALVRYGWKVFVSSLIGTIYNEINPLIVGLKFNSGDLAFYTKGRNFPALISTVTNSTLSSVLFPVLSRHQDDKAELLKNTRLFVRQSSFLLFPMMLGFYAVADNFVLVLLTEKWLPIVPYIRVFCLSGMFDMIHTGNCETIKAMGRSDIYLIMEIIKKSLYFVVIGAFVWLSNTPQTLAMSAVICTAIATVVNSIPNRKLIGYNYAAQIKDVAPNLLTAVAMCILTQYVGTLLHNALIALVIQGLTGAVAYFLLNYAIRNPAATYMVDILKQIKKE